MLTNTIFELAKEHRFNCDGSCSISLRSLGVIVTQLLGRDLTHEEFKILT